MTTLWVGSRVIHDNQLFTLYSQSWKKFKNGFFKIKCRKDDPLKRLLFDEEFAPRFPFYWQIPKKFRSCDGRSLSAEEKTDIEMLLDLTRPIDTKKLLDTQVVEDLVSYFKGECCSAK